MRGALRKLIRRRWCAAKGLFRENGQQDGDAGQAMLSGVVPRRSRRGQGELAARFALNQKGARFVAPRCQVGEVFGGLSEFVGPGAGAHVIEAFEIRAFFH